MIIMPRQARKHAESGIYHVMLRGINQQLVFEDEEDNEKFLWILKECKEVSGYKLLAYCLMGNHIHLLIKEGMEPLEQIFKRIGGRFVYWYNIKYRRVGHLFQDRFKSEPVENDEYLLSVIRYIHQNPVKAGICKNAEDYPYSSWKENLTEPWIVDVSYTHTILTQEDLIEYHKQLGEEKCLDLPEKPIIRLTDERAKKMMIERTGCESVADFQRLTPANREKAIQKLRKEHLSLRQISRLTGVSLMIIRRIVEK